MERQKVSVISVLRNIFVTKDDESVKYCKFTCLVTKEQTSDFAGYDLITYTTSFDNFDIIKSFVKSGAPVELELEYIKTHNGLYRVRPVKIGETNL